MLSLLDVLDVIAVVTGCLIIWQIVEMLNIQQLDNRET